MDERNERDSESQVLYSEVEIIVLRFSSFNYKQNWIEFVDV